MTTKGLKNFLMSFVEPKHQNFDLRFVSNERTKCVGDYVRKTRLITIYPNKIKGRLELLATGLHELAHHLTWECAGSADDARDPSKTKRARHHGTEFARHLKQLTLTFNFRHGEHEKGFMFCNARCPSRSPIIIKFSELDALVTPKNLDLSAAAVMSRFSIDNILVPKSGRRIVMIGFNGRNQAYMYSRRRKFNGRISAGWVKLLCAYAAATPKPGELWEFWVAAKRVLNTSGRKVG